MPLRVLHVHSGNLYGGVETVLLTLARCRHLAPSMEMNVALCFEGQMADELRAEQVPLSMLGNVRLRRPDTVWHARKTLAALLARERFDVVVCHQAWPMAVFGSVAKSASIPLVSWVHMAQARRHWLDRLAGLNHPDLVICNSHYTASLLPRTDAIKVETVYSPVISPAAPPTTAASPRAEVVIVQVSRMERLKGHAVLIDALAKLRALPQWVCWFVGGPQRDAEVKYMASLQALARANGIADRVRFFDQRRDVAALLAQSDIYCQPNLQPEGFGLSFVEALYAGLPVVTSAIGGAQEIVDATCGALVAPGDSEALATTLSHLITSTIDREALGARGPARARALCDPEAQMRRVAAVLEAVSSLRPALRS